LRATTAAASGGHALLRRALTPHAALTLDGLLDRLLAELVEDFPDDDCALLAVRAHSEDRPRPPEAGPRRP
jgi:hypothetical protein